MFGKKARSFLSCFLKCFSKYKNKRFFLTIKEKLQAMSGAIPDLAFILSTGGIENDRRIYTSINFND